MEIKNIIERLGQLNADISNAYKEIKYLEDEKNELITTWQSQCSHPKEYIYSDKYEHAEYGEVKPLTADEYTYTCSACGKQFTSGELKNAD